MYHRMHDWSSGWAWASMTLMMLDGLVVLGTVVYLAVRFAHHHD